MGKNNQNGRLIGDLMHFFSKKKLIIGISFCTLAFILFTSVLTSSVKAEVGTINIETIFHVYVNGERIGSVDDQLLVERLIESKIHTVQEKYRGLNIVVGEDITIIKELVFNARTNNTITMAHLEDKLSVKAEAVALMVDDENVGYVSNQQDYEQVIEKLKLQYVTKAELVSLKEKNNDYKNEMAIGEKQIIDVNLSKEIEIKKVIIDPKDVLTVADAFKQLRLGTLEEDIYVVKAGDVLGSITSAHNLSIQDIITLNPSITEDTLLQIGDELNLTVYNPIVKVIVEEQMYIKEEIPYQTETLDDATMWRGDMVERQKGENGERIANYVSTKENGQIIKTQVIHTETIKQPVNRIVVKGTKVSPSRGTGRLAWPAVGGYISSFQGMRWGRLHKGIDIAGPTNRTLLAADNGTVSFAGWKNGYGKHVIINHNNGMETTYSHLSSINVKVGQTVAQGQKIGIMGATGNVTGVHLHLEVYKNGVLQNPMDYLNR